jgi:hypothetical protein
MGDVIGCRLSVVGFFNKNFQSSLNHGVMNAAAGYK